ncbi:MAG: T9SS type A sorting domain-containing protein [Bacteroidota bacterium]|nr:T9SS type A sorting domain-containing protein [Bacteroidota bacterium]
MQSKPVLIYLLLTVCTIVSGQEKRTYQVAYNDYPIQKTETGWLLPQQPVSVTTSESVVSTVPDSLFGSATLTISHAGKTQYYSNQGDTTSWLGFTELSKRYAFHQSTFDSFYEEEVSDSLDGSFGKISYNKIVRPTGKGTLQLPGISYENAQQVESTETIRENTQKGLMVKCRKCQSFYLNSSLLPVLEYVSDTFRINSTKRVIEFILFDNSVISKINEPKTYTIGIYPNPVKNKLTLTDQGTIIDRIRIFSATGKLMQTGKPTGCNIDVSGLTSGIYLLEIKTGEKRQTVKFIKQ